MANKTNEPVKLRGQLIKLKEVAELCAPFWSVDSLRNAAMRRNAPFPIKQIGSRWYAFREDVEEYMQGVYKQFGMDAPAKAQKTEKKPITPVSILDTFRKDCKTESIRSIVTFGYGDLYYRDWGSVGVKVPEINAKRKIFDACIANSDTFRDITKCKRRANKFKAHFCSHISELMNENGEIPSLYTAKNENGYVIFAFVFVGFELDINCRLRAIYMFVQNGIYGTEHEIIKWCNTTNEIETNNKQLNN